MNEHWFFELGAWRDFYVFSGTAAATLMGLMFVVVSLGQRSLASEQGTHAVRAFFTPIVAFFTTEIVISMFMLLPRPAPGALAVLLAGAGITGLVYMFVSGAYRQWRSSNLGLDDWLFYFALPCLSYLIIGAAALGVWKTAGFGLYGVAAAMILLLLIGIRNAWDLVVYITLQNRDEQP